MTRFWRLAVGTMIATLAVATAGASATGEQHSTQLVDQAVLNDLAPTGELRVAINLANVAWGARDPGTGELRGLAIDLASDLSRRLSVSMAPLAYFGAPPMLRDAPLGLWDIAFVNLDQGIDVLDHTPALVQEDYTYLVPEGSPIVRPADVDRPGVRIALSAAIVTAVRFLEENLQHAELVFLGPPDPVRVGFDLLIAGEVDALTTRRGDLLELADELPGFRVLEEGYVEGFFGLAAPKGRPSGRAYLSEFVEEAKATDLVQQALHRHGVRGVRVAY